MCGIFGIFDKHGNIGIDYLKKYTDLLSHRGPDDSGIWIDNSGRVGFGHRRLSIIDLTKSGRQPMFSNDSRIAITFNGEIYNHIELRRELSAIGYIFNTSTDTEVLLASYITWGESCLNST